MALARILIDGYSLLHCWKEIAPGRPRYSMAARDELVQKLTQYHDVTGTPITIVFDGNQDRANSESLSTPEVEIIFSRAGQTADQLIERVAHRLAPFGEVLAVTNDHAERDTVRSVGGMTASCPNFITTVETAIEALEIKLKHRNLTARNQFKRPRNT